MSAGASSSVTTAVSLSVGQKVANAVRPHFVWSTRATTSEAAPTIRRLICASSSVASLNPVSRVNPAAPMNAFWIFTFSSSPPPKGPTTDSASHRTKPPGRATVMPRWPASSEAMRSPLVMTVRCTHPPRVFRRRAMASAVVLASRAMLSPSTTSAAAAAPIRSFSARWRCSRTSNARSARLRLGASAPPWARMTRPSVSSTRRSFRMVTSETANLSARSVTRTRPCSSTLRAMCCWRSRANTSWRSLVLPSGPILLRRSRARGSVRFKWFRIGTVDDN